MKKGFFKFMIEVAVIAAFIGVVALLSSIFGSKEVLNLKIDNVTRCELSSFSTDEYYVISNDEAMKIIDMLNEIEVKTDTNKISNCLYSVAMFNDKKVVFRAEISSKSIRIDGVGSYVMPEDKGEELAEYIDGLVKKYNVD